MNELLGNLGVRPWLRGDGYALQMDVQTLHTGLVKLDNNIGGFKAHGFNVQSVLAHRKLKWAKLVGGAGVNAVERDASVGGIGIEDQCSHTIPFVTGVGIAAGLARIFARAGTTFQGITRGSKTAEAVAAVPTVAPTPAAIATRRVRASSAVRTP